MTGVVHFQEKYDRTSQLRLASAIVAVTLSLQGCDLFKSTSDSANDGSFATNEQLTNLQGLVTEISNEQDAYQAATELSLACGLNSTCESNSQLALDVQSVHDDVLEQGGTISALQVEVKDFAAEAERVIGAAEQAQGDAEDAVSDAEAANTAAVAAKGRAAFALSEASLAKEIAETNQTNVGSAHGRLDDFDTEYSPRISDAEQDIIDTNNVLGNDWSTLWGDKSVTDVIGEPNDLFTKADDGITINGVLEGHHTAIGYDNWISWFNGLSIAGVIGEVPQGAPKFAYSDTITGAIGTTAFPAEHIDGEQTITNAIAKLSEKVKDLEGRDDELAEEFGVLDEFVQKESFIVDEPTLFDWLTAEFNKYTTLAVFNDLDRFVQKEDFIDGDVDTLQKYLDMKFEDYVEADTFRTLDEFVQRSDFSGYDTLKDYTDATYAPKSAVDTLAGVVGDGDLPFQNDGTGTKPTTIVDVIGTIGWDTGVLGSTLSEAINYLANAVKANENAALQEVDDVKRNIDAEGSVAQAIANSISDLSSMIRFGLEVNFAPRSIETTVEDVRSNITQQLSSHVNINVADSPQVNNFYILHGLRDGNFQKFYTWARKCNTEVVGGGIPLPTSCEFVVVDSHPEFQYDTSSFTFEPLGQPDSDFFTPDEDVTLDQGAVTVLTLPYLKIVREAVVPAAAKADYF